VFFHKYRQGMSKEESEFIRALRSKGFAIVVFDAGAQRRGEVEQAMKAAGGKALKHTKGARS
jgi:hypothetical protein